MENGKRQNDCFFVVMCVGEVIIYFGSSSAINEKQWTRWKNNNMRDDERLKKQNQN